MASLEGCSVRYVPSKAYRLYILAVLPVPDTSVSSTQYQHGTGTGIPAVPVPAFIPVQETSVSSVQHQYRHRKLWYKKVPSDIITGTGHFGTKFGTASLPVPHYR